MTQAKKYSQGKAKLSLIDPVFLTAMARVLMMGEEKYGPANWMAGMPWSELVNSAKRHLAAVETGEFDDQESGLPHLAHLATNAMMLQHYVSDPGRYLSWCDLRYSGISSHPPLEAKEEARWLGRWTRWYGGDRPELPNDSTVYYIMRKAAELQRRGDPDCFSCISESYGGKFLRWTHTHPSDPKHGNDIVALCVMGSDELAPPLPVDLFEDPPEDGPHVPGWYERCGRTMENAVERIAVWADRVLPDRTAEDALKKLVMEELPELLIEGKRRDPMEWADVAILVLDAMRLNDIDPVEAIHDKMAINEARKWDINEFGVAHHVE